MASSKSIAHQSLRYPLHDINCFDPRYSFVRINRHEWEARYDDRAVAWIRKRQYVAEPAQTGGYYSVNRWVISKEIGYVGSALLGRFPFPCLSWAAAAIVASNQPYIDTRLGRISIPTDENNLLADYRPSLIGRLIIPWLDDGAQEDMYSHFANFMQAAAAAERYRHGVVMNWAPKFTNAPGSWTVNWSTILGWTWLKVGNEAAPWWKFLDARHKWNLIPTPVEKG